MGFAGKRRLAMLIPFIFAFAGGIAAFAALDNAPAQPEAKRDDSVHVSPDQMHQLAIVTAELFPFQMQRAAIGQIAFNEDTTTPIRTPFSGRVTELIAKIGDKVKLGDPLFEIASPDVVQPQNDYIAAITTFNKARSQLNLAQIAEQRSKGLYDGKAGAAQGLAAGRGGAGRKRKTTCARPKPRSTRRAISSASSAAPTPRSQRCRTRVRHQPHGQDSIADRRHRHRPQGRAGPIRAQRRQ